MKSSDDGHVGGVGRVGVVGARENLPNPPRGFRVETPRVLLADDEGSALTVSPEVRKAAATGELADGDVLGDVLSGLGMFPLFEVPWGWIVVSSDLFDVRTVRTASDAKVDVWNTGLSPFASLKNLTAYSGFTFEGETVPFPHPDSVVNDESWVVFQVCDTAEGIGGTDRLVGVAVSVDNDDLEDYSEGEWPWESSQMRTMNTRTGAWSALPAEELGLMHEKEWRETLGEASRAVEVSERRQRLLRGNLWDAVVEQWQDESGSLHARGRGRGRVVMTRRGDGVRVQIPFVVEPVSLSAGRVVLRGDGFVAEGSSVASAFQGLIRWGMEAVGLQCFCLHGCAGDCECGSKVFVSEGVQAELVRLERSQANLTGNLRVAVNLARHMLKVEARKAVEGAGFNLLD